MLPSLRVSTSRRALVALALVTACTRRAPVTVARADAPSPAAPSPSASFRQAVRWNDLVCALDASDVVRCARPDGGRFTLDTQGPVESLHPSPAGVVMRLRSGAWSLFSRSPAQSWDPELLTGAVSVALGAELLAAVDAESHLRSSLDGMPPDPSDGRDAVSITLAPTDHDGVCAIRRDGTPGCWERFMPPDHSTRWIAPEGVTRALALHVSDTTACARIEGGAVRCWSPRGPGEVYAPAGLPPVVDLALGRVALTVGDPGTSWSFYALDATHTLWRWNTRTASRVATIPEARALVPGFGPPCVRTDTGVRCVGVNDRVSAPLAFDAPAQRCVPRRFRSGSSWSLDVRDDGAVDVSVCTTATSTDCARWRVDRGATTATVLDTRAVGPVIAPAPEHDVSVTRVGPSRFTTRGGSDHAEVCSVDDDTCVSTWLPPVDGIEPNVVTDDGRFVVYRPTGVQQIAVVPVRNGNETRIDVPESDVPNVSVLGTAWVASHVTWDGGERAVFMATHAIPSGRTLFRTPPTADPWTVLRVAPDRWALLRPDQAAWITLRADGRPDGPLVPFASTPHIVARHDDGYVTVATGADDPAVGTLHAHRFATPDAPLDAPAPWCP